MPQNGKRFRKVLEKPSPLSFLEAANGLTFLYKLLYFYLTICQLLNIFCYRNINSAIKITEQKNHRETKWILLVPLPWSLSLSRQFLCGCNRSPVTFKRLVHWWCLCGGSKAQGQQGESWSAELERGLGTNPKCTPIPCAHPASCRNTCSPSSWVAERTGSNWRGWRRVSRS